MDIKDILSKVDHTLLAVNSTWEQIKAVIDDGIRFGTAPALSERRRLMPEERFKFVR